MLGAVVAEPMVCRASWSACLAGVLDGALVGTAVGLVAGVALGGPLGWVLLPLGLAAGAGLAGAVLRRRLWVRLDAEGIETSSVRSLERVPWTEVAAVGLVPGRVGRSGRTWAVGLCRRGGIDVVRVPALAVRTPLVVRLGDDDQAARTEERRDHLLDPVLPFAEAHGIEVVDGDLVAWWDLEAPDPI